MTIGFTGIFIVEVVGLTFKIFNPEAGTLYRPSRFFLDGLLPCIFRTSFSCTALYVGGISLQTPE